MDLSILYVLGIVVVSIAVFALTNKYLKGRQSDLVSVIALFGLGMDIVENLNLPEEPKIKKIGDIVSDTLNYIKDNCNDSNDKYTLACNYAFGLADKVGINLTDDRKNIIKELIKFGLANIK